VGERTRILPDGLLVIAPADLVQTGVGDHTVEVRGESGARVARARAVDMCNEFYKDIRRKLQNPRASAQTQEVKRHQRPRSLRGFHATTSVRKGASAPLLIVVNMLYIEDELDESAAVLCRLAVGASRDGVSLRHPPGGAPRRDSGALRSRDDVQSAASAPRARVPQRLRSHGHRRIIADTNDKQQATPRTKQVRPHSRFRARQPHGHPAKADSAF
jgi:hypothetical protein